MLTRVTDNDLFRATIHWSAMFFHHSIDRTEERPKNPQALTMRDLPGIPAWALPELPRIGSDWNEGFPALAG